ncbi:MAG: HD domain-containing protein [Lachnospiraceae bacterium]|nr:HD domain-containing protein [Lachnospiraceae bacterium]
MKFIKDINEGDNVQGVYFCKKKDELRTKTDKPYFSMTLQDKTGTIDAKVWDIYSGGIGDFEALDFIYISGQVTKFQSALQLNIGRVRKCEEGEYNVADYMPTSEKDIEEMYSSLLTFVSSVKNEHLRAIAESFFIKDEAFIKEFKNHSAAKSVHHGFIGGLLEHTLSVVTAADFYAKHYPVLNRDLLITAAALHDAGKVTELTAFPENDYSDEGQLLGHIYVGAEMIGEKCRELGNVPAKLERELKHCILAHHGKLEFGSPKKPALMEALALSYIDDMDAKMETFKEALEAPAGENGWLGFNRLLDSNIRKVSGTDE